MDENERTEFGKRIRNARDAHGLSQAKAAKLVGITTLTWWRAERGQSVAKTTVDRITEVVQSLEAKAAKKPSLRPPPPLPSKPPAALPPPETETPRAHATIRWAEAWENIRRRWDKDALVFLETSREAGVSLDDLIQAVKREIR